MAAAITTATLIGLEVIRTEVEVEVANGLPGLHIVGLPDKSVDESRERVRAAIRAAGGELPAQRITVNLSPADVRKEGSGFDLPIAIGILAASGQIEQPDKDEWFLGELALDGRLKPIRGMLTVAAAARQGSRPRLFLPALNAPEAALVGGVSVYGPEGLTELVNHLNGERLLSPAKQTKLGVTEQTIEYDLADIRGQQHGKRALEIAAAGGHNLLLTGPPGTGKTLLAKAMPGILPPLSWEEALEVSAIYSVAGLLTAGQPAVTARPFRSPHHSVSLAGLIGGGSWPRPGELSLAHRGVLFLDELPQFPSHVLEALRAPLEDRTVRISRAQHTLTFPADCALVGSANPCPCGFADDPVKACTCSPYTVERYRQRLSGPIRDRFDVVASVPRVDFQTIRDQHAESSEVVRERIVAARIRQTERLGQGRTNTTLNTRELEVFAAVEPDVERLLGEAVDRWQLSVRGYHRVLKVARTIADLESATNLNENHVAEALQYREPAPSAVTV
ncbi:ATP-binding protein [Patescibacteria group bacterium]|nr:ATP-binding protein [Patescibacteria group bacterium]